MARMKTELARMASTISCPHGGAMDVGSSIQRPRSRAQVFNQLVTPAGSLE